MKKPLKIALIVGGIVVAVIASFVGLGALWIFTAKQIDWTSEDLEILVTAEDLAPYFEDWVPVEGGQSLEKVRYLDDSTELMMSYDVEDDEEPYLDISVSHELKQSDADLVYSIAWSAGKIGMKLADGNVEIVERNDVLSVGDRSRFGFVEYDGETVGMVLVFIAGTNVYDFSLIGFYIDDPSLLREIFEPRAARLPDFE